MQTRSTQQAPRVVVAIFATFAGISDLDGSYVRHRRSECEQSRPYVDFPETPSLSGHHIGPHLRANERQHGIITQAEMTRGQWRRISLPPEV
jgi:hypothetical protein